MSILAMPGVQRAIHTALEAGGITLNSAPVPIVVNAKPDQAFPYIVIGEASEITERCHDSKNGIVVQQIDVWVSGTEAASFRNTKTVLSMIRHILDGGTLTLQAGEGTFRYSAWNPEDGQATVTLEGERGDIIHGRIPIRVGVDAL